MSVALLSHFKNLSVALRSQAPALLVTKSQRAVGQNRCKKRIVQLIKSPQNMSGAKLNKVKKSERCAVQPSSFITCDNVLVISYLYPIIMTA